MTAASFLGNFSFVVYRNSSDGGLTWGIPIIFDIFDQDMLMYRRLAVTGNLDGVVMISLGAITNRTLGWSNLLLYRSLDFGMTWYPILAFPILRDLFFSLNCTGAAS